jgi:hypothetical protein
LASSNIIYLAIVKQSDTKHIFTTFHTCFNPWMTSHSGTTAKQAHPPSETHDKVTITTKPLQVKNELRKSIMLDEEKLVSSFRE